MLNLKPIAFSTGLVLSKLAVVMLVPLISGLLNDESSYIYFVYTIVVTQSVGVLLIQYGRNASFRLSVRDVFLLTCVVWLAASVFASLPFIFIEHISFANAFFETMSGLTTTGSTVLSNLDSHPSTVLLWRSCLQWIGGIGFIVLGVAILPFLNVGGMRLFQSESSDWSDKSAPRMKQVATNMLAVYVGLSIACAVAYRFSGMSNFEAINHAMTTLSTGGFSTSDQSMSHFSSASHWVASLFMLLGGLPFLLFIRAFSHRDLKVLFHDQQIRGFIKLVLVTSLSICLWLYVQHRFEFWDALRIAIFNVLSIVTTTGFGLGSFDHWTFFSTVVFAFLMVVGACSGSTSGGYKIFRFQLAIALFIRQLKQLIHPAAVYPIRYNGRKVNDQHIRSLVAFSFGFVLSIVVIACLLSLLGSDPVTAISGAITAVANVGPGFGHVIGPDSNFASLSDASKLVLSMGMLMGRLEILTVMVLFIPAFWRYS
ncbi:TrkH family potassium uptake protein [Alginatibacterium sediminis]|uniref:Trk system potassium uptake protein n=1 Tax=Alginatibacterium sediminis TaxID=2164068 RepID=A0A420ENF6_9ALTE|nr:TrkH family potassium uptake protein [Alginatibacterium sediminis]RKF22191.1 TrkH family potassium uptake protein [Alginatibacterium sediminis]